MGQQKQGYILVAMANNDTYYISRDDASDLARFMAEGELVFQAVDIKSGARLTLQVPQVSSLVEDTRNA